MVDLLKQIFQNMNILHEKSLEFIYILCVRYDFRCSLPF